MKESGILVLLAAAGPLTAQEGVRRVQILNYPDCVELSNSTTRVVLGHHSGGRVLKYEHRGKEVLYLDPPGNLLARRGGITHTDPHPSLRGTMAIEKFDDLIGTWAPAVSDRHGERQLFHFSPLGHFVMEWGSGARPRVRICDLSLTRRGFAFTDREDGTATELQASLALEGQRLVLVPPHGERTILRRVVEEMEAQDCAFFVKRGG